LCSDDEQNPWADHFCCAAAWSWRAPHHHPRVIDRPKAVTTSTTDPAGAFLETKNFTSFHFLQSWKAHAGIRTAGRSRLVCAASILLGVPILIEHRPFRSLSGGERDWLKAEHHFPFENAAAGWGALRMWNDDEIVRQGAISHRDSLGDSGRIVAGDVQVISAGTGIRHSEFNLEKETTGIFQIWIKPTVDGGSPAWGTRRFPKIDRVGRLVILASGFEIDGDALPIRAQARVLGATFAQGQTAEYEAAVGRCLYLVPASGSVLVNGLVIETRDGAAIKDLRHVVMTALRDSEVVLVDAPQSKSIHSLAAM
jgi:hypothetical protein